MSPLRHFIIKEVRADLRRLLHFTYLLRGIWFIFCLLVGLMGVASTVSAQPELFGGNPDSSAFIRIPSNTDDWTRHFRIGALVGMNISANFGMAGEFGVNRPAGVYDNGYVHPSANGFGTTTDWGYTRASQYDATAHTLTMTGTTSFSTSGSSKESGVFPGFDMAYGGNLWYWKHARVGWELGFDLLPISITDRQQTSGQVNQNSYTFSTGNIESMPPPGYPGPGSGSAPAIYSTAVSTNQLTSTGNINGTQKLDVMLYTLRLGPTFYWDLSEHVSLSLGAGPAVGLVSGDYKYDETITIPNSSPVRNSGKIGGTDFIYGGYVNATVLCHVQQNADIYAGVQYMPMSDAAISGNGRSARLNLGGQVYFTVGINWPF